MQKETQPQTYEEIKAEMRGEFVCITQYKPDNRQHSLFIDLANRFTINFYISNVGNKESIQSGIMQVDGEESNIYMDTNPIDQPGLNGDQITSLARKGLLQVLGDSEIDERQRTKATRMQRILRAFEPVQPEDHEQTEQPEVIINFTKRRSKSKQNSQEM